MRDLIVCGDTLDFVTTLPDYPAATYTLKYRLIPRTSGTAVEITCTAGTEANDHRCAAAATTTATWTAGEYSWASWVEKAGERYQVDAGTVTLLPNPATTTNYDSRSHARKALDAIEAVLEGRATLDQEEYTIGGRSLKRTPVEQLIRFRQRYKQEALGEDAAERIAAGLGGGRKIQVRL